MSVWDDLVSEARSGGFSVLSDRAQSEIISMIDRAMRDGFERGRHRTPLEQAAPALLEALEAMMQRFGLLDIRECTQEELDAVRAARAAIAAAKGDA